MFFDVSAAFCPVALAQGILVKCSALWVAAVAFASTLVAIHAARVAIAHGKSQSLRSGDGERRSPGLGQNEYGIYKYLHMYGPVPSFLIGLPQELACPRPPTPADSKYLYLVCFKDAQRSQTASRSVLAHSQVSRLWVKRE